MFTVCYAAFNISRAKGSPFETRRYAPEIGKPAAAIYEGQRMSSKKKNEAEKLTKLVSFRLAAADHAAYLAKVGASGMKPSTFFREAVLTNRTQVVARPKSSESKERLVYLFNKASNNMNQLAHRANADHLAGFSSDATYSRILAELQILALLMKQGIKNAD